MAREKVAREVVKFPTPSLREVEAAIDRTLPMRAPGSREERTRISVFMSHADWLTLCGAAIIGGRHVQKVEARPDSAAARMGPRENER